MASSEISDAVSKPNPKRKPTRYICQLCPISLKRRPNTRVSRPPATSSCSSDCRDVVGIEGVAKTEGVGETAQAEHDRVPGRDQHQHDAPAQEVEQGDAPKQAAQPPGDRRHRSRTPASNHRNRRRHPSTEYIL